MTDNVVNKIKDAFEGILNDKRTLIKILSIVLILLLAAVLRIHDANKADITVESADSAEELEFSEEEDSQTQTDTQNQSVFVDISGAVEEPGVYEVSTETRLFQVIDMAGGLTDEADTDHVNRASFVEDGQKIVIPVKGSETTTNMAPVSDGSAPSDSGLININTASADELKTLNGIGAVTAEKIISYRSARAFKSIEDIMSVDGIGEKTYEKIKDDITV